MSFRSDWEHAKKSVQPPIPKDFFGHANLGPLLDKAEKAEADYDKLPGTAADAKQKTAKKKAYDAYTAADKVITTYLKQVVMAEKANKSDHNMVRALDTMKTFLSMKLSAPIDTKRKRLKS